MWYGLEIADSIKSITDFIIFVMNLFRSVVCVLSSRFIFFACWVTSFRNTLYDIACNKVIHIEENVSAYYWFYYNRIGLHEQFSFLIEISIFYYSFFNLKISKIYRLLSFPICFLNQLNVNKLYS